MTPLRHASNTFCRISNKCKYAMLLSKLRMKENHWKRKHILFELVAITRELTISIITIFKGVESGSGYLKQPTLTEALPLSPTTIFLEWKGPINHPGGFNYRIYLKKGLKIFKKHKDVPGNYTRVILSGLEENTRYEVCVRVMDNHYETAKGSCDDVAVITTPAQLGKY